MLFPHLAQPIKIGRLEIPNRLAIAPLVVNLGTAEGGYATDRLLEAYRRRGSGGWGLIIVEGSNIDSQYSRAPRALNADRDKELCALSEVVDAIKDGGDAKVGLQINHPGRIQLPRWSRTFPPVAPSRVTGELGEVPRALTDAEVEEILDKYAAAAQRVKLAGFDLVQIHGAHGQLVPQFMSPYYNRRDDRWGGPLAFVTELIKRVKKAVGQDFPVSIRISGDEGLGKSHITLEYMQKIAPKLVEAGVDCIDVSAGMIASPIGYSWVIQPIYFPRGCLVHMAEAIKKVVSVPVVTVGRIFDPFLAENIVARGRADIVSFGRPSLADFEFAKKTLEDRVDEIRKCICCMEGCYRELGRGLLCTVNYEFGRLKYEYEIKPAFHRKKVMVVGGGVGGMEAARVARIREHQVTLYEKRSKLGGAVALLAAAIPRLYTRELKNIVDWQTVQLNKLEVRIELGIEVSPEFVEREKPEVVILATGSRPRIPQIPGIDRKNVILLDDYLINRVELGRKVVVLGGHYGAEVAVSLGREGKEVTVVEETADFARPPYFSSRRTEALITFPMAEVKDKIRILTRTKTKELTDWGVVIIDSEGTEQSIEADSVLIALDRLPENVLAPQLKAKGFEVYEIGDCVTPKSILYAMHGANRVIREI